MSDEIQLVYRRKPRPIVYIRALPSTVKYPKDAQVELRILFARAAKKARGKKGLCKCHNLPWAAHYVLEELEGYASTLKCEKKPVWKQRLEALENIIALVRKLAVTAKS